MAAVEIMRLPVQTYPGSQARILLREETEFRASSEEYGEITVRIARRRKIVDAHAELGARASGGVVLSAQKKTLNHKLPQLTTVSMGSEEIRPQAESSVHKFTNQNRQ